eukprot:CAMPEP_0176070100 /NCGR_PEP_ID=MMETSP0120_2-20121206/35004_1 /TAXON_ID=160619 /ORGANISM="Kryptoperidinium foliaceum, Strain CCMP 1326" /LENGTH=57 /DNA_ID=CAMNT_0017403741 /DNA_START=17 /DNA_END=190 /DNA_ORIENTATION=-
MCSLVSMYCVLVRDSVIAEVASILQRSRPRMSASPEKGDTSTVMTRWQSDDAAALDI